MRNRLTRRGLAPTELGIGAALRPTFTVTTLLPASTIEATINAATALSSRRANVAAALAWSLMNRIATVATSFNAGGAAALLVVCVGLVALGTTGYRAGRDVPRKGPDLDDLHAAIAARSSGAASQAVSSDEPRDRERLAAQTSTTSRSNQPKAERPRPLRFPTAYAPPLANVVIDGRLDEWPEDLTKYPVRNQLRGHPDYNSEKHDRTRDSDAYFKVGFDRDLELIYLAVVVPDQTLEVHPDGRSGPSSGDFSPPSRPTRWRSMSTAPFPTGASHHRPKDFEALDASTMPVLQYVECRAAWPRMAIVGAPTHR